MAMKPIFLALCLLGTTLAFGQQGAHSFSSQAQAQPYESPSHPQHAAPHALATERFILAEANYFSAQGERKISDLPHAASQPPGPSLGETARLLKKEHLNLTKARIVFED
jgi:hypothetical protein